MFMCPMGLGEDQDYACHMVDLANGSGGRVRSFCVIRRNLATDSDAVPANNSDGSGNPFRSNPATLLRPA
jgi:hypothetical protein